jgi:hypothetical protein
METRAIGVSLLQYPGVDLRRPCAASGNVADFRPGAPETELLSDLHRAAQPLRVDGDPVAQPARHSSTCAPGAACRALRRHPGAGRCKPAAVRPKSLLWIDVPLRSRSREWLLLPLSGHRLLRNREITSRVSLFCCRIGSAYWRPSICGGFIHPRRQRSPRHTYGIVQRSRPHYLR